MENEFPPNSNTQKEERPRRHVDKAPSEKKEVARVAKGKVTLRKKPLHKRFFEAFKPEDNKGLVEYVVLELLVDGLKDAAADAASSVIDNLLGTGGSHRRRRGGGGYTSYNRMSQARPRNRRDRDDDDDRRGGGRRASREEFDIREAILESRVEAEEILDNMYELLSKYDAVTMRDLLSMLGEPHWTTDEDWGWTDLRGARIHRVSNRGYLLDLPRAEPLD